MQTAETVLRKDTVPVGNTVPKREGGAQAAAGSQTPSTSTNQVKRVALIGAGYIATVHAEALRATKGAKLVGIIDPRLDRAASLARRNGGVAAAASLGDMLDNQQLDAVHVLTPPNLHTDLTIEALSRGLSVLLEKPMASAPLVAEVLPGTEVAIEQTAADRAWLTGYFEIRVNSKVAFLEPESLEQHFYSDFKRN